MALFPHPMCCGTHIPEENGNNVPNGELAQPARKDPEKVTINLYFRHFAWAYVASFFGTLLVAGIVTFTASPYSPETDKITLFYGMFNPCIWFDHYPAKIFATTGMGAFLLVGVAYNAMVFVYVYSEGRLLKVMWSGVLVTFVVFIDLMFVNVFTTNLYPMEDAAIRVDGVADGIRRLHGVHHFGVNNTVSLVMENELTKADIRIIKLHTAFYIQWVVGQVLLSFHMFRLWWEQTQATRTYTHSAKVIGFYTLGWFGMFMHAASMLIIIMHPEPKVEWYFNKALSSILQDSIIWVDAKTFTSAWGWVPIMLFRLVMPKDQGISVTFRLERMAGDQGFVMPETWMNRTMWMMALILTWAGIFDTDWGTDDHAMMKLMFALRLKPFSYFGGPCFLACVILLFVALGLQVVQKTLLNNGVMPKLFSAHALVMWMFFYGTLLVILEKATWVYIIFLCGQASFVLWVIHMNKDEIKLGHVSRPGLYNVCGVGIMVCMVWLPHWQFYFIYLLWMALYGNFVPDGPFVYITVTRLGEQAASYKEVPHTVPNA